MVFIFGRGAYRIDGATVSLEAEPALSGGTEIRIPPIGTVSADTHMIPARVILTIEQISLDSLKKFADSSLTKKELFAEAERQATVAVKSFIAKLLLIAFVAGAATGVALPPRQWRRIVTAALVGLMTAAVLIAATIYTYDYRAFRQPRYTGMLTVAPWLMSSIEDKLNTLDAWRQEVKKLASNLHYFYARVEKMGRTFNTDDTVRVLQVSDIHNNPVGLDLIKQVARDFRADFIIDNGDITDFGTPIEAGIAARVKELKIPYVFVPGNHDSPQLVTALEGLGNVRVLRSNAVETVKGITILGYPDPFSTTDTTQQSQSPEMAERYAAELAKIYRRLAAKPDVIAVHEPENASKIIGRASVILAGHTHQPLIDSRKGTILINAGTSGAAGLRTFEVEEGVPYNFKLLYFQKNPVKLIAVDSMTIKGVQREFVLERTFVGNESTDKKEPQEQPVH